MRNPRSSTRRAFHCDLRRRRRRGPHRPERPRHRRHHRQWRPCHLRDPPVRLLRQRLEIVAVCDAQDSRRLSAKSTLEKLFAEVRPGGAYRGIRMYADFRELLAQKDIDAVYIASPDHWHVSMLIPALKAGKHVHCEKPLGVSIEQDLAALKAVRQAKAVFQYGAERRSTPDARNGIELVLNGRIGKVTKVYVVAPPSATGGSPTPVTPPPPGFDYDMWLGPAPPSPSVPTAVWKAPARTASSTFTTTRLGNIANWAAHPLDQVQWWADNSGRTVSARSLRGRRQDRRRRPLRHCLRVGRPLHVRRRSGPPYARQRILQEVQGRTPPQLPFGRPGVTNVHNGAVFIGTEGWVIVSYEKLVTSPASLADSVIGPNEIHLPDTALASIPEGMSKGHQQVATAGHHQNWLKAIRGGPKPIGDIEGAVRSDLVSLLSEAPRPHRPRPSVGPPKADHPRQRTARKMIKRPMRAPWGVA